MATLREQAREKLVERRKLIEQNRAVIDERGANQSEWPQEDRDAYTKRWEDIERLKNEADTLTEQAEAEDGIGDIAAPNRPPADDDNRAEGPLVLEREFRTGNHGHISGQRTYRVADADAEERRAERLRAYLIHRDDQTEAERRALQMDADDAGGYTVAPQQFVADLIQAVDNRVFFRGLATVNQLMGAHTIGRPSLDADPADPTWTTELQIGSEDSSMDFGKRELSPHPLAQYIKVSRKLLRHSPSGPEALVRNRLAYKNSVVEENAFMNGSGAQQPLGIFTASSDGISTSRDVSTGNTTTEIRFDGLKSAKWELKSQYWPSASWIFHRDAGQQIDKLKDGNGQYIWQPSVQAGVADRLLGFAANFSEYAPNTFTTGQYVGILGDYSFYWIVESLMLEIQRLDELYAASNQVGFISRSELDGMPVLEEAFVRVTLG